MNLPSHEQILDAQLEARIEQREEYEDQLDTGASSEPQPNETGQVERERDAAIAGVLRREGYQGWDSAYSRLFSFIAKLERKLL